MERALIQNVSKQTYHKLSSSTKNYFKCISCISYRLETGVGAITSTKTKESRDTNAPQFHHPYRHCSSSSPKNNPDDKATDQSWSEEWKQLELGARLPKTPDSKITNLVFVQTGFGVDQHGSDDGTKAAVRAVRNAIEFNSIPGVITTIPGGRSEMLIRVKLGLPSKSDFGRDVDQPLDVDLSHVAKVFPYGRLLPIETVVGGLSFPTGRVVEELGDRNDVAVCCVASVSIGYDDGSGAVVHRTYSTKDGY